MRCTAPGGEKLSDAVTPSAVTRLGMTLGSWSVDPTRNVITRDGEERQLENRVMQTLVFLMQQPGQTITREQFFDSVWKGRVVNEEALSRAISLLRSALDDSAQSPQYIQTIPGMGYRLIAEVGVSEAGIQEKPTPVPDQKIKDGKKRPDKNFPLRNPARWALGTLIFAAVILLTVLALNRHNTTSAPDQSEVSNATSETTHSGSLSAPQESSLAVLPFTNLSDDPQQDYFADGMTEELLNMLARIPNLRVTARTSAFYFKDKDLPASEIARVLNVDHVLEGSVRRNDEEVRVTVQLIEAETDRLLWSETIEREAADVFVIQDELAAAIAGTLASSFKADAVEPASRSASLAAYEAYRTGRLLWWQRSPEAMHRAIEYFELAMESDPGFSPAYAAAADTWMLLTLYGGVHFWEGRDLAEPLIEQALALDPESAEAHAALGLTRMVYGRNIEAEQHLRNALKHDPTYIPAHLWLSNLLANLGRIPEEGLTLRRALAMDPLNPLLAVNYSVNLQRRGHNEDAANALLPLLRLQPANVTLLSALSEVKRQSGALTEALLLARIGYRLEPENVAMIKTLASALMAIEEFAEAERILQTALELNRRSVELKMHYIELLLIEERAEAADAVMETLFPSDISTLGVEQQYTYHYYQGLIEGVKRDFPRMRDHLEQVIHPLESQLFDNNQIFVLTTASLINRALGETERAEEQLSIAERVVGHAQVNGLGDAAFYYSVTGTLSLRGEIEMAEQTLQQAIEKGFRHKWLLDKDGRLDPLRDSTAFAAARAHLVDEIEAARVEYANSADSSLEYLP